MPGQFPFTSLQEFQEFETTLLTDEDVRQYMVKGLAALGGSGVESLVRRIMKYILSNEVAVLFYWKGRDKLLIEKIKTMELIQADVKVHYPAKEINELNICNTVKDWQKCAKARIGKKQ